MALPTWNPVNVNFSGSNNSMSNATQNINAAGSIFGGIVDKIDRQAQMAAENARADAHLKLAQNADTRSQLSSEREGKKFDIDMKGNEVLAKDVVNALEAKRESELNKVLKDYTKATRADGTIDPRTLDKLNSRVAALDSMGTFKGAREVVGTNPDGSINMAFNASPLVNKMHMDDETANRKATLAETIRNNKENNAIHWASLHAKGDGDGSSGGSGSGGTKGVQQYVVKDSNGALTPMSLTKREVREYQQKFGSAPMTVDVYKALNPEADKPKTFTPSGTYGEKNRFWWDTDRSAEVTSMIQEARARKVPEDVIAKAISPLTPTSTTSTNLDFAKRMLNEYKVQ